MSTSRVPNTRILRIEPDQSFEGLVGEVEGPAVVPDCGAGWGAERDEGQPWFCQGCWHLHPSTLGSPCWCGETHAASEPLPPARRHTR